MKKLDVELKVKRHMRWLNWYCFFSNRNPHLIALFSRVVETDREFRDWIKGSIPANAQKLR